MDSHQEPGSNKGKDNQQRHAEALERCLSATINAIRKYGANVSAERIALFAGVNSTTSRRWLINNPDVRNKAIAFLRQHEPGTILDDAQIFEVIDNEQRHKNTKQRYLSAIIEAIRTYGLHPSVDNIARIAKRCSNATRKMLHVHPEIREEAIAYLKEHHPEVFRYQQTSDVVTKWHKQELADNLKRKRRFVITAVMTDCPAQETFLDSLKTYAKRNDAEVLFLLVSDPAHSRSMDGGIDQKILDYGHIVLDDTAINSNVFVSSVKLSAKHIDPITSLGRIGQRDGSFIYASPKQRLKLVPVNNQELPHAVMTTGACTLPNYDTERYMSRRTAYIAEHDHVMGGIIVEREDDNYFHYRQLQADADGRFIDLGVEYSADGCSKVAPEAMVLGDWHSGIVDETVVKVWRDIIRKLKPKKLVLHDLFNGLSISHHDKDKIITRAQRAEKGQLSLDAELEMVARDLDGLTKLAEGVIVVRSNHDDFLNRYLEAGRYVYDPHNHRTSLNLALAMLDEKNPLEVGVMTHRLQEPDKVKWLERDEDYQIAKIQLGAHGDKGAHGSRGSIRAMENAYLNSVTGHTHTPEILRGAWQVGTSTILRPDYVVGTSAWFPSSCLVYGNGARQLVNAINGRAYLS